MAAAYIPLLLSELRGEFGERVGIGSGNTSRQRERGERKGKG